MEGVLACVGITESIPDFGSGGFDCGLLLYVVFMTTRDLDYG